jgi:PAS domain S-box-containing protein
MAKMKTNTKKLEEKLRQSESKYRNIIDAIPLGMHMYELKEDGSLIFTGANPEADTMLGVKHSLFIGKTIEEAFPGLINTEVPSKYREISGKGSIWHNDQIEYDEGEIKGAFEIVAFQTEPNQMAVVFNNITERKRSEILLQEKDLIFQSLLDNSPVYIFFKDHNIKAKHLSKNYEQMLGMPLSDILGKDMDELFPSDLAKSMIEVDKKILFEGKLIEVQEEFGGRYYTTIKFPINRENNTPMLAGFTIDITEQKKAEMAVKQSEARLSAFMEFVPSLVLIKDHELRLVFANNHYRQMFPFDDWVGKKPHEIFPKEVADLMVEKDTQAIEKGYSSYEETWKDKNGFERTYLTQKFKIEVPGSEPMLGAIISDITDRKKAELAVIKSESKLKSIFSAAPIGIGLVSNRILIQVNDRICEMTGYSSEELVGKSARIFYPDDKEYESVGKTKYDMIAKYGTGTVETLWKRKDGSLINIILSSTPLDQNNLALGVTFTALDITERKKTEENLKAAYTILEQANQEYASLNEEYMTINQRLRETIDELQTAKEKAEESDRLKSAFLANLSHEIRTPMNGIVGFTSLLSQPDLTSEKKDSYIKKINTSSTQLLSIINDIIQISMLETKQVIVRQESVNIEVMLDGLFEELSFTFLRDKKIKLIKGSKKCDKQIVVETDKVKLQQIITNLITNAIKYTPEGTIEVGYCMNNRNMLEFYVKDTGIGIDKKYHELIFDRFQQVHDQSSGFQSGSGLGLAISKSYVELLGGRIWLESEPGKGSEFFFEIPCIHPTSEEEKDIKESAKELDSGIIPVILIVEDDEVNTEFLKEVLGEMNAELIWATNGKEAIELCLANNKISLVLMDIKMPVVDGFEALTEINKVRKTLPVLAQTAYALHGDEQKAYNAGFEGYIAKPYSKEEIIALIAKFVQKKQSVSSR